jgi:DNA-binding Lrp family transcriptional regulator
MMDSEYKFESKIKGFTLVLDVLVLEAGLMEANVYGKVWRYAQQKDKVCYASVGRLARELNLSSSTIKRYLAKLVKLGYLVDYTPNLRNRPHTYGVTNKVEILQTTEAKINKNAEVVQNELVGSSNWTSGSFNLNHEDTIRDNKRELKTQAKACDGGDDSKTSSTTIRERVFKEQNTRVFLGFLGDDYKELGQAFLEHAGADYSPNGDGDKRLWVRELKKWRAIGVSTNDIKSVVDDMRKRGLSIKSPVSITGMLRDCKAKQSKERDKVFAGNESDLY